VGITQQQLAAMQHRIASGKDAAQADPARPAGGSPQIILGIDPSLRGTGYGVIDTAQATPATLSQGTIRCPADWPLSRCLSEITETLEDILKKTKPTVAAVEGLFFAQNIRTALIMGQARGAALATLGKAGLDVFEIAPRKVKQAIVGYGAAQKEAVAKMVQTRLALPELPTPDAADALAIALTYAQSIDTPLPDKAIKPV
jgi:crossover junction endodeoxyribonuclease RuvC